MASEKQLGFFKLVWEEELAREKQIKESAKTYLTLTTAYSAFLIFVGGKVEPGHTTDWNSVLFMAAVVMLGVGFALCVWVTQSAGYEVPFDPSSMMGEIDSGITDDEDFFDRRIADYAVACGRNDAVNSRKAEALFWAGWALLGGIVLHAAYFVAGA